MTVSDGITDRYDTDNSQSRQSYDYIVIHTSEGNNTALGLAAYCDRAGVSYNVIVDDNHAVQLVANNRAPWAAMAANGVGLHICAADSFAAWSRGTWLADSRMLDRMARWVASMSQQHNIPLSYSGDHGALGWPRARGVVGHMDFGSRGGGHHDPGNGFPFDELLKRAHLLIAPPAPVPNLINIAAKIAANWIGKLITPEKLIPGGAFAAFEHAHIYWRDGDKVAHPIPHDGLFEAFAELGFEKGLLGWPTRDHTTLPDGGVQAFQGGVLYRQNGSQHGFYVHGAIGDYYAKADYERGGLGYPTSNEYDSNGGRRQDFEHNSLFWTPTGGVVLTGVK